MCDNNSDACSKMDIEVDSTIDIENLVRKFINLSPKIHSLNSLGAPQEKKKEESSSIYRQRFGKSRECCK